MRRFGPVFFLSFAGLACAQESQLSADFRHEAGDIGHDCTTFSFGSLGSCAYDLFTDHPMHIAVGSLAPQNGFGAGLAFVSHWTPNESWRLSWDVDAVATPNGSWRGGAYMTAVLTRHRGIVVQPGGTGTTARSNLTVQEYPVFNLYTQATSLHKIGFYGLGPDTPETGRSWFGERETIVGANVVWPVIPKLNASLFGEVNGRFAEVRPGSGQPNPTTQQLYTDATAPGLSTHPSYAQFGEGVRVRPQLAGGYIRLNYSATYQQFIAQGNPTYSFQRLAFDFDHQFPLYRTTRSLLPKSFDGPDDCSVDPAVHSCPSVTRNREGSVELRLLINESFTSAGHVVPFYFQPTLGGSDINGSPALPSYPDYRFRAPNSILARASFEHSIYGPFGFTAMIDEGKVALTRGDLDFTHLLHSYSVGATLRAGGFPMVFLLFSWGGHEGNHTTVNVNNSLLGGSARPSLY